MMHMSGALMPRKFNSVPIQDFFTRRPEVGEIFYLTLPGRSGLHIYTPEGWARIITHHQYISEVFSALPKQMVFTLTKAKYVVDGTSLQVFKNGLKLVPAKYAEIDNVTIMLKDECKYDDQIEIIVVNSPSYSTEVIDKDAEPLEDVKIVPEEEMTTVIKNDIKAAEQIIEPAILTVQSVVGQPSRVYETFIPTLKNKN